MNLYYSEKYRLAKGVEWTGSAIVDKRIAKNITIDQEIERECIEKIVHVTSVDELMRIGNQDELLFETFNNMYKANFIELRSPFRRKVLYSTNKWIMFAKLFLYMLCKLGIFVLPGSLLLAMADIPITGFLKIIGVIYISVLIHEMGHVLTYIILERDSYFYFLVDMGEVALYTKQLAKNREFFVALMGPLCTIVLFGFIGAFVNNTASILVAIINLCMLLPICNDGKNIWQGYK